jgi:thiol-disulfide isomerase/thioredoxin
MKKFIPVILIAFFFTKTAFAQSQYEVLPDKEGKKILKGIISQELLVSDTSFKWYAENLTGYTPDKNAVAALKKNADSIELMVFIGTWCSDSHFIIPKLYALLDASGFSKDRVTLIGVDRSKKTLSHLAEAMNIINVPTIIVMKEGKEMGRVVEYGKYGLFDMELAEIINSIGRPAMAVAR